MSDFLLDVHTEPFPARFVAPALEQLKANAASWLAGKIEHGEIAVYGTLRHLVLTIKDVAPKGKDKTEKLKGPKEAAWKTADGKFSPAAEGFARKHGLSAADLKPEGGVMYAEVHTKGASAEALLEAMIPELLKSLQFPKFMTWEESGFKFGRPLRAITALYGSAVVPVKLAGLSSGRSVYGHPTYAPKAVELKDPSAHVKSLREGQVIADPVERRTVLLERLEAAGATAGGKPELDEELVDETVNMAEQPTPVVGRLREEHMHLPPALLKMVMKKQLKFFPVVDAQGAMRPAFIGVRDGLPQGNELVREGYQRVLEARFNDAAFFFGRDTSAPLESRLPQLERVTYQKALGSMAEKAARVAGLAQEFSSLLRTSAPIAQNIVATAARLVYADLVTDVVKEFPELQGVMGGIYARRDGLDDLVAQCVEQFYFPITAGAIVPKSREACVISLAGKLDSIAGCFAAGLIPTGSADPYALRRQALGVIRILVEREIPLDLNAAIMSAVSKQPATLPGLVHPDELLVQIADFIWGRAVSYFEDKGYRSDEIRSIRYGAFSDLMSASRRLAAVKAIRRDSSFEKLAESLKRASNILKQSKGIAQGVLPEKKFLREDAEIALLNALDAVDERSRVSLERADFVGALHDLSEIKPHLDQFFDNVMVMVDDAELKRQRLAVLAKLVRAFNRIADLSEIQPVSRTPGEIYFSEYLSARKIQFEYEPRLDGKSRRPDFLIPLGKGDLYCEVKDFESGNELSGGSAGSFDPYPKIRQKIDAARQQFSEFKDNPCCLVLYGRHNLFLCLDDVGVMLGAMYGDYGVSVPMKRTPGASGEATPIFQGNGKMIRPHWTGPQNTTISAIITLHHVAVGRLKLEKWIQTNNLKTPEEILSLTNDRVGFEIDEKELGVIVWENAFARIPIPRQIFNGPCDVIWGADKDGTQKKVFVGEKIKNLEL